MKLNDHLDFHKLPFDKEKIREQVEKIAADCMHWVTGRQNARPLLAMVLCTCIAFSAMLLKKSVNRFRISNKVNR